MVGADQGRPVTAPSARDEVLARIRSALADRPAADDPPRPYRHRGDHEPGHPALIDLLAERLTDYRAWVWRAAPDAVAATIARALADGFPADRGRPRLVVPADLPDGWLAAVAADIVTDELLDTAALDACDGVITAAAVAVAETGTIVLDGTAGQGRRAITLVPDLHVCVVLAGQVVATVPEAIDRLDPTRPLTWISGPSATSDIELDRVEGVHGPRTLEVVLVAD
jgi:L-lactate dehydrogenase complex protein LldG